MSNSARPLTWLWRIFACALLTLLIWSPGRAQTGNWLVSYASSGTWSFKTMSGTVKTWPWGSSNISVVEHVSANGPNSFGTQGCLDAPSVSGTITPTLTWSGSGPVPATVNFLVTSTVWTSANVAATSSASASDGFGDPSVPDTSSAQNPTLASAQSVGNKLFTINTAGQTVITCPPISISSTVNTIYGDVSVYVTGTVLDLQGHSTLDTAGWYGPAPRFFSGTNCSTSGTALAGNGSFNRAPLYVKTAQLSIGGQLVKSYYDNSVAPSPLPANSTTGNHISSTQLSSVFDSTHFADNTSVAVTLQVTPNSGAPYTETISGPNFNRGNSLGNMASLYYGAQASADTATQFQSINYRVNSSTTMGKSTILATLPNYTMFYIWTHGLDIPSCFGDCLFVPPIANNPPDYTKLVFANHSDDPTGSLGVTDLVATKGLLRPAFNIVFIDACLTSQNGQMPGAFGITTSSTDLAYIGYTTESDDNQINANFTHNLIADLTNGMTTLDAINDAKMQGYPTLTVNNVVSHAEPYAWGDKTTKAHGVYSGVGTAWFK